MTRVALVLGGGGVAGYAFHTGVLAALALAGWDPRTADVVVGTSAGSIVAAAVRSGLDTAELTARVLDQRPGGDVPPVDAIAGPFRLPRLWRGPAAPGLLVRELGRGTRLRPSNLVAAALPEGRQTTAALRAAIEPLHGDRWPERALWIPVTELDTGRRVVIGRDRTDVDVATAVEASCAIPGYFAPVTIGERRFVDGGMRCPDNADVLLDASPAAPPLDLVIVSAPLSITSPELARSPLLSALRAYPRRRLQVNVERLRRAGMAVLAIEPDLTLSRTMGINAMNPGRLAPIVEASARYTAEAIEAGTGFGADTATVRLLTR
ncbi:MAG: patatin-like phospholipase family protein [Acidimicrobiales bacterium]